MKALLLDNYQHLEIVDHPDPQPGENDVVIRVKRCGICGSDIHGYDGSSGRRIPPIVMGHEASGVIESVGPGVSGFTVGERCTFDSTVYCGECGYCRSGRLNLCDRRQVLGVSCDEYRRDGAFAEYISVPARGVYRLPDSVSFEDAALTEPLSIAVHAAELAGRIAGRSVAVVGAGVIGSLIVSVARAAGCARLVALDPDASRRERIIRLGADTAIDPVAAEGEDELIEAVGGQVDIVFEAVGIEATVTSSIDLARKGGAVILVGNVTRSVEFQLQKAVTREIRVQGSCGSAGEYDMCLDLLSRGAIASDLIVNTVAPLDDGASWFARLYARESDLLKILLAPNA